MSFNQKSTAGASTDRFKPDGTSACEKVENRLVGNVAAHQIETCLASDVFHRSGNGIARILNLPAFQVPSNDSKLAGVRVRLLTVKVFQILSAGDFGHV